MPGPHMYVFGVATKNIAFASKFSSSQKTKQHNWIKKRYKYIQVHMSSLNLKGFGLIRKATFSAPFTTILFKWVQEFTWATLLNAQYPWLITIEANHGQKKTTQNHPWSFWQPGSKPSPILQTEPFPLAFNIRAHADTSNPAWSVGNKMIEKVSHQPIVGSHQTHPGSSLTFGLFSTFWKTVFRVVDWRVPKSPPFKI